MDKFRGTGRTIKMLDKAISSRLNGYTVTVIALYKHQVEYFNRYFEKHLLVDKINVCLYMYDHRIVVWDMFTLLGVPSHHKVFFDHTVIEHKFPEIADDYNFLMSVIDN